MNTTHIVFPSNIFCDVERTYLRLLSPLYGEGEVRQFVRLLAEAFLGWSAADCLLHRHEPINQSDLLRFHWALSDLQRQRPIQHIIGHTDFCGCRIMVNPSVLIPRPETEELVLRLIRGLREEGVRHPFRILDLCTGSGCIAIALKKAIPEAVVMAVDLSAAAMETARRNAEVNGVDITFVQANVLYPADAERVLAAGSAYSLIVSNPPYVMESERSGMQPNVLDYEPSMALFVPNDDALCFYRAIAAIAAKHLAPHGLLALEINETQGLQMLSLLRQEGFEVALFRDFNGRERSVEARR